MKMKINFTAYSLYVTLYFRFRSINYEFKKADFSIRIIILVKKTFQN